MKSKLIELLIEKLPENEIGVITSCILIALVLFFPTKTLLYSYKAANDLGIVTPIKQIVSIFTEGIVWLIIIGMEGIFLAEFFSRYVSDTNKFFDAVLLIWFVDILVLICCIQCENLGEK